MVRNQSRLRLPAIAETACWAHLRSHGRPPFAEIDLSSISFASEQIYDVVLDLVVTSSRSNMDLGNFMVDLELHGSKGGAAVIKSARSVS